MSSTDKPAGTGSNFLRGIIERDLAQGSLAERRIAGRAGKATVGVGSLGEVAFDDAAQEIAAGAGGLVGAAHGCMGMGLGGF